MPEDTARHLRICFVADSYPSLPRFGGIAVYTQIAARALAQRGHEVHVLIASKELHSDATDGTVSLHFRRVRWIPLIGGLLAGFGESFCVAWWLRELHRKYQFDIVEIPNWEGIGLVAAWLRIAPIVVRQCQ